MSNALPAVDLSDTNETQGSLPLGRGGTGGVLSPAAGAVVYSTGAGTAGQFPLSSCSSAAPFGGVDGGTL